MALTASASLGMLLLGMSRTWLLWACSCAVVGSVLALPSRSASAPRRGAPVQRQVGHKGRPPARAEERKPTEEDAPAQDDKPPTNEEPTPSSGPKLLDVKEQGDAGVKTYKFGPVEVEGRLKSPQVVYFLRRVRAEFGHAPLGHRSFLRELSETRNNAALR